MKTGIELITEERTRQKSQEGWTPEHDNAHNQQELNDAAQCYLKAAYMFPGFIWEAITRKPFLDLGTLKTHWPWDKKWWKPSKDKVRNLVKAGALIAAEIDRLQRLQNK